MDQLTAANYLIQAIYSCEPIPEDSMLQNIPSVKYMLKKVIQYKRAWQQKLLFVPMPAPK